MVDQRGRDNPPPFHLPAQMDQHKYHAVLVEPMHIPSKLVFHLDKEDEPSRDSEGQVLRPVAMGIYGFPTVEARDKFCRVCNGLADAIERKIALPVTLYNFNKATGPVVTQKGTSK